MGRMKELFMKQIEEQMGSRLDEDYEYEMYQRHQKELEERIFKVNDELLTKYSDADVKYALESVFGKFNVSDKLKSEITQEIMLELNKINNLRNGNID